MSEFLYNKKIDIIEDGLEKLLYHLRKWRQFHSGVSPDERDYVFFKDGGVGCSNNIIKLSDIIDSGKFLIEIKYIFSQSGEWSFGAYSPNNNQIVHPVMLYDRRKFKYTRGLRTPFIMPLIHQLKDAYIESRNKLSR